MAKKQIMWKTKGMNQDMSVSAFDPEFAFENMNLRLSTNEGNTLMSWVNEKGTSEISLVEYDREETPGYLDGVCIGTAVLNEYLVMFMSKSDPVDHDCIYRLNYNDDKTVLRVKELYRGDLNFDVSHPIETLVSYESEHIQKVYWTDHKNQPRLINIAPDNDSRISRYTATSFDFIPTLELKEDVKVVKMLGGGGMFAPGVIQYAFTYYNKHGQESNIFHVTPLYYLSHKDRGASPEEKVDNTFKITVNNLDYNFDYLRIYSIQRSSINGTPICKRIQDVDIKAIESVLLAEYAKIDKDEEKTPEEKKAAKAAAKEELDKISYTDTGMSGDSIDPTELLYKGGSEINIGTMGQKDGTLFMGDITLLGNRQPNTESTEGEEESIQITTDDISIEDDTRSFYVGLESSDNYVYGNQLNAVNAYPTGGISVPCSGFKHGDWYRCGIQLQDSLGRWTDPIFLDDIQIGNFPSITNQSGGGGEHSDEDLELVVRFVNTSGSYITMQNEITIGIEPVSVNSTRAAQEPIELTIRLDMPETMQFAPGSNELISGVISQGRQYTGSRFVALEGQSTPASVKDSDGNPTHAVTVAFWEDVKTVLGTSLEVVCTSTTNPDDVPVPVPPEPPVWTKDFEYFVKEFNKVLNTPITENSNTWNYLLAAYNMAKDEWDNDSIGLFNIVNDSSVEIYNYRGTDVTYAQQAQESLYSWLMAMCLSELVPSSGSSSNKQTQLYQKAYDLVAYDLGGGRFIPLYGNFDAKGDVMLARLVAAGIYAKNRAAYSFDDMDAMRSELGGSVINISGSLTETGLGYDGDKDRGCVSLGYTIGINSIFPAAPGPYLTDTTRTQPHPSSQGQSSDLFYSASDNVSWHKQNYKVDVAVDDEVTSHYNLRINQSTGETEAILKRSVQAVADEKDNSKHWFSEKTYYKYNAGGTYGARFTFTPGTPSDNNGYFTGTFNSEVTGKDLSSLLIDVGGDETDFVYFMNKMGYLGGIARYPLLHSQYGRRRPGQGETDETCRCARPGAEYNRNWLDDSSIARLAGGGTKYDADGGAHAYYIDKNSDGDYDSGEPYYNDGWAPSSPEDELYSSANVFANTYPSGHSSGTFAAALFTIQFFPTHCADIFKAAYKFSVSRTIERAHWNSDITYGRLIGTMMVPVINAIKQNASRKNDFRLLYQSAYNAATGGPTPGNAIRFVVTNNTGYEARFTGKAILNLSHDPDDWSSTRQANANFHGPQSGTSWDRNDIIIPPGGSYTSPEITTIDPADGQAAVNFLDGSWYIMNSDNNYNHTILIYTREYSKSRQEYSGSNHMFWIEPLHNAKLIGGQTYYLDLRYTTLNPQYADTGKLAILADASTTKSYVDGLDDNVYGYAILAEGKTTLVEE